MCILLAFRHQDLPILGSVATCSAYKYIHIYCRRIYSIMMWYTAASKVRAWNSPKESTWFHCYQFMLTSFDMVSVFLVTSFDVSGSRSIVLVFCHPDKLFGFGVEQISRHIKRLLKYAWTSLNHLTAIKDVLFRCAFLSMVFHVFPVLKSGAVVKRPA